MPRPSLLTSSFNKRCNIYCHILAQEYCAQFNHRRIYRILGTLITRGDYTFQKVWQKESKKHIAYDGRLAFFDNYEKCIDCGRPSNKPSLKFTIRTTRPGKLEDGLLLEGIPETFDLPFQGYKACLFALNSNNFLFRIDLENGKVLEEVYIGNNSIKFRRLQWNMLDDSFIIYSTKRTQENNRRASDSEEVMQLVLMSCMPLEFTGKFSITKQVFGKDVSDATVFLNILVLTHTSSYVRMYSLERIMAQSATHHYKLYTKLGDGQHYGLYPSPLSHNIDITERPECLFEVRCYNNDVMVMLPPCHYVMCPYGQSQGYRCMSFDTHHQVRGGYIEPEVDERISLHFDDSPRIVQMKNEEVRVLKLVEVAGSKERQLVEDFVIKCTEETKSQGPVVSQSGRIIKQPKREGCINLPERQVHTMAYSEEQDMILLLFSPHPCRETGALHNNIFVGFYDNRNGELLRQFALDTKAPETLEQSLYYDLDTLTHVYKTMDRKFDCHLYKLQAIPEVSDEWRGTQRCTRRNARYR